MDKVTVEVPDATNPRVCVAVAETVPQLPPPVHVRVVTQRLTYSGLVPPPDPVRVFEDSIQGPAPLYTKVMPLANGSGSYQFEIVVKDTVTGKLAADTIEFEVK